MRNAILVLAILLAVAGPATADQASLNPRATTRFGAPRPTPAAGPYAQLFQTSPALTSAAEQESAKAPPKSKIVCGMLIVEADPNIDPKMRVTPPQDQKLRYAIRVFEPPTCKSP